MPTHGVGTAAHRGALAPPGRAPRLGPSVTTNTIRGNPIVKNRLVSTTLAALAGVGLMGSLAACNQVATAEVGACVNMDDLGGEITDIPTVDCSEDHDGQVVGKFDLDDGDYPGDDAIVAEAEEQCRVLFEEFVGISYDESSLLMRYVPPSQSTWEQANDREVICFAISETPATGSWEGAAI